MEDLRYPVGLEQPVESATAEQRAAWLDGLAVFPAKMRAAVKGLSAEQLAAPYRPGGWTVRQVVHHVADSHMHAYIRTKFALAAENPTIMPYDEAVWAKFADVEMCDIEVSLSLLDALHARWVALFRSFSEADWQKKYLHPERGPVRMEQQLPSYEWHCRHHCGHITALRARMGW